MLWVYDRTGSVLVAMLTHASLTASLPLILMPPATGVLLSTSYLVLAAAPRENTPVILKEANDPEWHEPIAIKCDMECPILSHSGYFPESFSSIAKQCGRYHTDGASRSVSPLFGAHGHPMGAPRQPELTAKAAPVRLSSWCSRRPRAGGCNPALDLTPPPDRPDPSIYSQAQVLAGGAQATWDNPDIVVYATPQHTGPSWRIDPAWFLSNSVVRVRNRSTSAPAINTAVAVSYSDYGIGMARTPITTLLISLAAGEVRQLSIPLPAAVLNQTLKAVSLFVDLSHPYDSDPANNAGASSSAISLIGAGISAAVPIPLGNPTTDPITYNLALLPNSVGATLSQQQVTVAPGANAVVNVFHGALAGPPAKTSVTVVARDALGNLIGGFTWLLYFG